MTRKTKDATADEARELLEAAMRDIVRDRVVWFAIAWKNKDGTMLRARTKLAPKTLRLPN